MKTTKELLKMAKEQNTTVDGLFRSPKRLSLENIESLPKASVIWREQHATGGEKTGIDHYLIEPMLICVSGKGGVLAWADKHSCAYYDIDESLINDHRIFWSAEPETDMISAGVPDSYYDQLVLDYKDDFEKLEESRLIYEITHRGFTLDLFAQASGINTERLIRILIDPDHLTVSEMDSLKRSLSLSAEQAENLFLKEDGRK